MLVSVTKLPNSTLQVKGVLPSEEFNAYITKAAKAFTDEVELPGFRKGKAPEKLVLEKVGEGKILEEAARMALNEFYPTLLKEHAPQAIGRPQIRITKLARGNPLEFEADIAVLPEVDLADYKGIATKKNAEPKEESVVSDEELQKTIDWLRKSRSSRKNDTSKEQNASSVSENLPELTDEFAQSLGTYKTVEELKNAIRENMKFEKEQKVKDKRRMELLEAISEASTMELPDILVESEKDKMHSELKAGIEQMGMQWDVYLTHIKKKEEELRNEWQTDAQKRVRSALALREIAKRESIEPTDDELNAWAYQYLARVDENEKKNLDLERVKDYAYDVIRNQKVLEFLERLTA